MSQIDGLVKVLDALPPTVLQEIDKILQEGTGDMVMVPTVGPQYDAYYCEADEVFMGGSAGGGKSALAISLALNEHEKSLILRRFVADAKKFAEQALDIVESRDGFNGQDLILRRGKRRVQWGGVPEEKDKQRYKGEPNDLIVFDELPDFLESQYLFITAWNRSANPDQRCRIVCTGNPPTTAEGLWVIRRWGAWLDPKHPNPAKSGELRWFIRDADDRDIAVSGPGEFDDGEGRMVKARSRTFIRARLDDNPDLTATDDYARTLDALPKEIRDAYRDGRFDLSMKDNPHQVIPTAWVQAAQARWEKTAPFGIPQCSIGVDGARSQDKSVLAPRYDGYYSELIVVPGSDTPNGKKLAGLVIEHRRNDAMVVVDAVESVGAQAYAHLKDTGIDVYAFRGNDESIARTAEKQLGFFNRRSEAYWRFREALDPEQDGGSSIALPDDPELVSDLTAPTWELTNQNTIKIEPKAKLVDRLGRSPDRGDAVVMSWYQGARAASHMQIWMPDERVDPRMRGTGRRPAKYNRGPRRR